MPRLAHVLAVEDQEDRREQQQKRLVKRSGDRERADASGVSQWPWGCACRGREIALARTDLVMKRLTRVMPPSLRRERRGSCSGERARERPRPDEAPGARAPGAGSWGVRGMHPRRRVDSRAIRCARRSLQHLRAPSFGTAFVVRAREPSRRSRPIHPAPCVDSGGKMLSPTPSRARTDLRR
jgi:hypothetical protein